MEIIIRQNWKYVTQIVSKKEAQFLFSLEMGKLFLLIYVRLNKKQPVVIRTYQEIQFLSSAKL